MVFGVISIAAYRVFSSYPEDGDDIVRISKPARRTVEIFIRYVFIILYLKSIKHLTELLIQGSSSLIFAVISLSSFLSLSGLQASESLASSHLPNAFISFTSEEIIPNKLVSPLARVSCPHPFYLNQSEIEITFHHVLDGTPFESVHRTSETMRKKHRGDNYCEAGCSDKIRSVISRRRINSISPIWRS